MTFVIPLRFHEGRDESMALIPVSSLLRNVENVDALFLGWTEQKNAPSEDDVLVPYSLLKHTILLEPYICFLFTLRSSPTVSEVGLPLPFVTTLDRRDEEGLFASNIRLPDVTNCLCVFSYQYFGYVLRTIVYSVCQSSSERIHTSFSAHHSSLT